MKKLLIILLALTVELGCYTIGQIDEANATDTWLDTYSKNSRQQHDARMERIKRDNFRNELLGVLN